MNASTRVVSQLRQNLDPSDAAIAVTSDNVIEITSPSAASDRSVEVRVRDAANLEVAFIVPSKPGSPFEQVFTGPSEEADAVIREAVAFVCDLVAERVVLAWDSRPLCGGRRFLKASDLGRGARRDIAWVVSWRGKWD